MRKEILEKDWHSINITSVLEILGTKVEGLFKEEVEKRFKEDGSNILKEKRGRGIFSIFFNQFRSPLIYVLILAAGVVTFLGELTDGVIIFFVLFVNALVGTFQEGKAEQTLRSLKKFSKGRAVVLRDGIELEISDEELVLGDVIIIRSGDKIPADARIINLQGFKLDESSLTGESEPVFKTIDLYPKQTSLPERKNMIYKGTLCVAGEARALVVATGIQTMIGSISEKLALIETEMPLKGKIKALSKMIGLAVFGAVFIM